MIIGSFSKLTNAGYGKNRQPTQVKKYSYIYYNKYALAI
jgi:hypothetical protein